MNSKSEYWQNLERIKSFAEHFLKIAALVGSVTFFDYFWSEAEINKELVYEDHSYNQIQIMNQFAVNKMKPVLDLALKYRPTVYVPDTSGEHFGPSNPFYPSIDTLMLDEISTSYQELKSSLNYQHLGKAGSSTESSPMRIINRTFWENEFIQILENGIDTLSVYKAMKIVLANREVHSFLHIRNKGRQAAKNLNIYLANPTFLEPRSLSTSAQVEYLRIDPLSEKIFQENSVQNIKSPTARIFLPYLEANEDAGFLLTTSLQNPTEIQIKIVFDTDRRLDIGRVKLILLFILILYFGSAVVLKIFKK